MLAAIRPGDWNLPLLVHVAGAMLVVGGLVVVAAATVAGRRRDADAAALTRLAFRTLLLGVLPSYVLMRGGAEWIASKQEWGDPAWIGIGYATADGGLLLTIIATVVAWRGARAPRGGGVTVVAALAGVMLVAYVITVWAMTTKAG